MTMVNLTSTPQVPLKWLEELADIKANGYFKSISNGITWLIYFVDGKIFYASFSIEPLDRLEYYTRQTLAERSTNLDWKIFDSWRIRIAQARLDNFYPSYDYQAAYHLVKKNCIQRSDGIEIIKKITREALGSFLLLPDITGKFVADDRQFPILWSSNFLSLTKECQDEINNWRKLAPVISSPYQRPYLINQQDKKLSDEYTYLKEFIVGVDFFQLSLQLQVPPLVVAQSIHKLVLDEFVGLRNPKSLYNKLPRAVGMQDNVDSKLNSETYKIVCVDDSPTILKQIHIFLDSNTFHVFPVLDSALAITKIIQVKPNIILLDIDMPNIDGYKLCSLVRKNIDFKHTPIIMVTSNSGLIDRARAKLSGATDYMTKPFHQAGLNEIISKYLT